PDSTAYFPRGLHQPEQGYRFSVDSLLLAAFASPASNTRVADLGCGCGVVGLGLLLQNKGLDIQVTGLDVDPVMIKCARHNARLLGMQDKFQAVEAHVAQVDNKSFSPESFDMVIMNPPYRPINSGRVSDEPSRQKALFCSRETLGHFLRAASFLLKNRAVLNIVFGAERLAELIEHMKEHNITLVKILPVHGRRQKPARLVLVQGRKNTGPGTTLLPGLVLYDHLNRLTPQALQFCPCLGCNRV
ncbi:MAG: tRNA1(Val) (adenine(37)-N6)-methyltransferase, partial [Desulfonatronovibrionaceae bacterium]